MGAGKWRSSYTDSLRGVARVVVIADKDDPGRLHARGVAASLTAAAIETAVVEVPTGKDASDWIAAGARRSDFERLGSEASAWTPIVKTEPSAENEGATGPDKPTAADDRPAIYLSTSERAVVDAAIQAMTARAPVFQRGLNLVQTVSEPTPGRLIARDQAAPRIVPVSLPWIQVFLSMSARFHKQKSPPSGPWEPAHPPDWVVKAVATAGTWPGIRYLRAVIETPVLRADGTVLNEPGYDPATQLVYQPLGDVPRVPARPTRSQVEAARDRLLTVVADFPFKEEAHKAAWFAALLTPLLRWAFDGPVPLFLIEANIRAAGKSLLARATALTVLGRVPATMTLPADEDERRKRITALAMAGDLLVFIDNIEGVLGGATLNAALTSTTWSDRILGVSTMTGTLPLYATWLVTGNNPVLGADISRRVIAIRLESSQEKPEERTGFEHPDLLAWIRDHRTDLVADALTVCAGYFADGCPDQNLPSMGSFEGWNLVRQIVVWAGLPDPLVTQRALAATSDREVAELSGLIAGIEKAGRKTARGLLEWAGQTSDDSKAFRDVLLEHLPTKGGDLPTAHRLAGRLRHFKGRVAGGKAIDSEPNRTKTDEWLIRDAGVAGVAGVSTSNARARDRVCARACARTISAETTPASPASPASHPAELAVNEVNRVGELGAAATPADVEGLFAIASEARQRLLDDKQTEKAATIVQYVEDALEQVIWLSPVVAADRLAALRDATDKESRTDR